MGLFPERILEWVAFSSSRGPPGPKDLTHDSCVSCKGMQITAEPSGKIGQLQSRLEESWARLIRTRISCGTMFLG